jgi:prevent-host-death family protein
MSVSHEALRDDLEEALRRAQAGELMIITVAGRPVAQLGPVSGRRQWVRREDLDSIWKTPAPKTLARDLESFPGGPADPFA